MIPDTSIEKEQYAMNQRTSLQKDKTTTRCAAIGDLLGRVTGVRRFCLMKKSFLALKSKWSTLDTVYWSYPWGPCNRGPAASFNREAATRCWRQHRSNVRKDSLRSAFGNLLTLHKKHFLFFFLSLFGCLKQN